VVGNFFYLHFADEPQYAFADAPPDRELGKRLLPGGWIPDWKILHFELKPGLLVDYLANRFAFRLCSERLREVIEQGRDQGDVVQWLPALVRTPGGKELPHWILHFPEVPDVLNKSKTVFAGPMVVKAVLDSNLVDGHRVFSFPNEDLRLIIATEVKEAIEGAGCSGMTFSRVPIA
jgi:hypothetical protein